MTSSRPIYDTPAQHLWTRVCQCLCPWRVGERVTRVRNLARLVTGLVLGQGIHLSQMARAGPYRVAQAPSQVLPWRRFLDHPRVDVEAWFRPVRRRLLPRGGACTLRMDCSQVGARHRLLSVGLAFRKRTVPRAWSVQRGPKGHVGWEAQRALLTAVAADLDPRTCVTLRADAGFAGAEICRWLWVQQWQFVLRTRGHPQVRQLDPPAAAWTAIQELPLPPGDTRDLGWVAYTRSQAVAPLWLTLHWEEPHSEPWYLWSAQTPPPRGHPVRLYRQRLWMEEMYGDMKRHGFQIQDTQIQDAQRISRLRLGVALAYAWLLALGAAVVKRGLRPQIDVRSRRDQSYARLGRDWLQRPWQRGRAPPLGLQLYR